MDLSFPIPQPNLRSRFHPLFSQFASTRHATLVALPHSGRSSHLRFIASQPHLHPELGIPKTHKFIWIDNRKFTSFTQLATQIALSLNPSLNTHPSLISQDEYLVLSLLKDQLNQISQPIIMTITLDAATQALHAEVEEHFVLLIKQFPHLNILWSLDSTSLRSYSPGHGSTPILESVHYFPSFNETETLHSLRRIAHTRNKTLSKEIISSALDLTGGLAGLFHLLVYQGSSYLSQPGATDAIQSVSQELTLSPDLSKLLATNELRVFIAKQSAQSFVYSGLRLKSPPTAQELGLLDLFRSNLGAPLSRDQIANSLWGKHADSKYSDWAIDKAISRLRNNLDSKEYQLITVKNLGYSLICLSNSTKN